MGRIIPKLSQRRARSTIEFDRNYKVSPVIAKWNISLRRSSMRKMSWQELKYQQNNLNGLLICIKYRATPQLRSSRIGDNRLRTINSANSRVSKPILRGLI
jgi:hypothetical protein